jgi:uncharacterized membrane protein YdbT with pleckstrin-like domain
MHFSSDETIVLRLRKHWVLFAIQLIPIVILAIVPVIFPSAITFFLPNSLARLQDTFWVLYFMWLIVLWVWGFIQWTEYYLDMWVVTDRKIISADQKSLFRREVSTLEIEKIQDISIEVNGFIETLFGYGTIRVQTAGESREFIIDDAAQAEVCKKIILDTQATLREEALRKQGAYMASGITHTL